MSDEAPTVNDALDRLERGIVDPSFPPNDAQVALVTVRSTVKTAKELLQEVLDEHMHVGLEHNWCNFCGLAEGHEIYCVVPKIENYLKGG